MVKRAPPWMDGWMSELVGIMVGTCLGAYMHIYIETVTVETVTPA